MASGEVQSLRDTIMPEVYAISAEHQRRVNDQEDMPLDDPCTTLLECIASLTQDCASLVAYISGDGYAVEIVHRVAITLATDAAEIARRVRPK